MSDTRTTYVYRDGLWLQTKLKDVNIGEIIKMYEPTGEPVFNGQFTELLVLDTPFLNDSGKWQCDISDTVENIIKSQKSYILRIGLDKFLDLYPHYLPYEKQLRAGIYTKK